MEFPSTTEDILSPLKPLFLITRIFGLTHAESFDTKDSEESKTKIQHIALVSLWIAVFLAGTFCKVYVATYEDYGFPNKVNVTVIANVLLLYSTTIVTLIAFSVNRRNFPGILRKLRNIDTLIKCESRMEIYKKIKREVRFHIATLSLLIFVAVVPEVNFYTVGRLASILGNILQFLSFTLNMLTVLVYTNIIRMVKYRYRYIFELLEKYFKAVDMRIFNKTDLFEITSSGDIEIMYTGRSSLQLLSNQSKHLQTLRLMYIEMYDTVQLITSHFGVPVLFHILTVMVACVPMFYSAFHLIHSAVANSEGVKNYFMPCFLIFWGIMYVIPFVWLVISCDEAAHEANRGVIYIQRVKASPHTGQDAVTDLEKLSSQLKDMKVEFSVCGLIVLSLPFLCTFVGGIFTYIIIMVQLN